MTPEERVTEIEARITSLEAKFSQTIDIMQHLGGAERVFQAVTLALIDCHPDKEAVSRAVFGMIENASTEILFRSENEHHNEGSQAAYRVILDRLNIPDSSPT